MRRAMERATLWRVACVMLSGLLVLGICHTVGFAEQIEATPEGASVEQPVVEAQGADDGDSVVKAQGAGDEESGVGAQGAEAQDDDIQWKDWTSTDSLPTDPGNYLLTNDVKLTDTWNAPRAGESLPTHLCLNGHSITLAQNDDSAKPVIRLARDGEGVPCMLVLHDESANKGTITHAQDKEGTGVLVESGGKLVMKGGSISNNISRNDGGGVVVDGGTFTMEGGVITDNKRVECGGGVAVKGGTFNMAGGTIQNNGGGDVRYGGGVYVGENGTLALTGGTVTKNTARVGGGVACIPGCQVSISGNPRVTENTTEQHNSDALGNNLCLIWPRDGRKLPVTIDNPFGEGAEIGISIIRDGSMPESPMGSFRYTDGVFTSGYRATQSTDPWHYFTCDDPDRQVLWTSNGTEAQLTVARRVTVAQGITGGKVTPSREFAAEGETITIQATPNEGWELVSVTATDADGEVAVKDNKEFVVRSSDVVVSATFSKKATTPVPPVPADMHVTYTAHVQGAGELPAVKDGKRAGTTGESRRLEAISATVDTGGIEYRAHLQGKGWDNWVANGKQAGTTGESRRLEAIQMRLTGSAATDGHHVWYRVHSQTYGWLGWACDGEPAGTTGMSKRVEAYQVLVLQGSAKPNDYDASKPAYLSQIVANGHLQGTGWTGEVRAGVVGTTGQARRMEALTLTVPGQPFSGGIAYQVHEQGKGWTDEQADGALAGTTGESRRIEAVRIRLTGDLRDRLSVWYRVHSQTFGWSGWASDGDPAGTAGLSRRAEAVELLILPKGAAAPGSTANALRTT